jgi:hypothetical protein
MIAICSGDIFSWFEYGVPGMSFIKKKVMVATKKSVNAI